MRKMCQSEQFVNKGRFLLTLSHVIQASVTWMRFGKKVMAVGRVFMSSAFLLCFSVPLLFSVEDAGPQHRASFSSYPWSF